MQVTMFPCIVCQRLSCGSQSSLAKKPKWPTTIAERLLDMTTHQYVKAPLLQDLTYVQYR